MQLKQLKWVTFDIVLDTEKLISETITYLNLIILMIYGPRNGRSKLDVPEQWYITNIAKV